MRSELHLNPRTLSLSDLVNSIYFLLSNDVNSEYGKLLEPVEPPDPCAMLDPDEEREEMELYKADICKAKRLVSRVELNQWLVGLYDGRFWKPGWEPED